MDYHVMNDHKPLILSLFLFTLLSFSTASFSALSLQPQVPGYSASSGNYRAPSGTFTMAAANSGYIQPSTVTVSGKPITVSATMRMASNAGQFVKNSLRLNPYLLVGTLAASWLLSQGMNSDGSGGYSVNQEGQYWIVPGGLAIQYSSLVAAGTQACFADQGTLISVTVGSFPGNPRQDGVYCQGGAVWNNQTFTRSVFRYLADPTVRPAKDSDWDALPDPLPALAPELPFAPYLPEGVPVNRPQFEFAPFTAPIGEPYTKPDGSTVQSKAKVSPNGNSITIDTYDEPVTNPDGTPATDKAPIDTPEPAPDQKTQCDQFPETLGCSTLGNVPSPDLLTEDKKIDLISPEIVGGAGSCPSPLSTSFMGRTISFSYDMPCKAAEMLKPLILALAWLSAGLIFIGGVRQ